MNETDHIDKLTGLLHSTGISIESSLTLARALYEEGIRYVPMKWRIDETYVTWGRRVHNRLGARFDSKEDAEAYGRLIAQTRPGKDYQWCATQETF